MLPVVNDEVKRFYSELSLKEPAVRNPFTHRVQIFTRQKKLEVGGVPFNLFYNIVSWLKTLAFDLSLIKRDVGFIPGVLNVVFERNASLQTENDP